MSTITIDAMGFVDELVWPQLASFVKANVFSAMRAAGMPWSECFELFVGKQFRNLLSDVVSEFGHNPDRVLEKLRTRIWALAGFVPTEGLTIQGDMLWKRILTDRDADLNLGLFTNVAPTSTITLATITQPTGTGYATISLTDASWTNTSGVLTYATQTFTGGTGGWTGSIQGYFVSTNAAGGTPGLMAIEVDANGPYTINAGDTYAINLQDTLA